MNEGGEWTVVVPVKTGDHAKSRLGAGPDVAAAIAADTLRAVAHCRSVRTLVVVSGPGLRPRLSRRGLSVLRVTETTPEAGLNAAIIDGLVRSPRDTPTAVVLGDLPALRPASLGQALARVAQVLAATAGAVRPAAFVPDAEGSGTVLLGALDPESLVPRFGPGSAAAHEAGGAVRLDLDLPDLRRDVDTPADLAAAADLGLGSATDGVVHLPRGTETA